MRGRVSVALKRAGWVEATQVGFSRLAPLWCRSRASPRSLAETHHCHATRTMMGFASLDPSYALHMQVGVLDGRDEKFRPQQRRVGYAHASLVNRLARA